jgi:hypothetical protein
MFINGQCHFWAMSWGNTDMLAAWGASHEGQLDAGTERMLAIDSQYGDWNALKGRWGLPENSDGTPLVYHDTERTIACISPCENPAPTDGPARFLQVQRMYRTQIEWVAKLYEQGAPSSGPMRIAVFRQQDNSYPGLQRVAWPLSVPLESVVDEVVNAQVSGSHLIDRADDTTALRDLRSKLRSGALGPDYGLVAIQNDQNPSTPFLLYARDAVSALEDAQGLIPIP